jgi:hypothetical protein
VECHDAQTAPERTRSATSSLPITVTSKSSGSRVQSSKEPVASVPAMAESMGGSAGCCQERSFFF